MKPDDFMQFAQKLWPLNRSLSGRGVVQTLQFIKEIIPELSIKHVKSGTIFLDWEVPKEWNISHAYIIDPLGNKICDYSENNLSLVGYSAPIAGSYTLDELQKHLFSLPEQPDAIPYVTSYYKEFWGFCISHNLRNKLVEGIYQVVIDGTLQNGQMHFGELVVPGSSKKEILISTYICHPSMANDQISGIVVSTFLAKWISENPERKYTYRFVFIPETVGSKYYISQNYKKLVKNVVAGFNITCVGDERCYSYLPSRDGHTLSDQVARHVLNTEVGDYKTYSWKDRGSDERQYCAPGIDLPIATIMRSKYGCYPEYHTSLDTLKNFVTANGLFTSYELYQKCVLTLENFCFPRATILGEPKFDKRNMKPYVSQKKDYVNHILISEFLTWSDGRNSLIEIAEKCDVSTLELIPIMKILQESNLIIQLNGRKNKYSSRVGNFIKRF